MTSEKLCLCNFQILLAKSAYCKGYCNTLIAKSLILGLQQRKLQKILHNAFEEKFQDIVPCCYIYNHHTTCIKCHRACFF